MPGQRDQTSKDIKALQDMVFSSNYGVSRDFIAKNEDLVNKSNKAVNETLLGFGVNNITSNNNSLQELQSLVAQSIKFRGDPKSKGSPSINTVLGDDTVDTLTGIKDITPLGNMDASEHDIISQYSTMYQSFLATTSEYRGVVEIIPEVARAIENICRDILSVSELSGRALNKLYDEKTDSGSSITDADKKEVSVANDILQKEIVDKNDLEKKLKRWVYESLVCGVKPIAFIPYDYIIRQMNQLNAKDGELNLNVTRFAQATKSGESCPVCDNRKQEEELYNISIESSFADMLDREKLNGADPEIKSEEYYNAILDDDLVEKFADQCEANFAKSFESLEAKRRKAKDDDIRYLQMYGVRSTEANEQLDLVEAMTKKYSETKEKLKDQSPNDRRNNARRGLKTLARFIDEHIDVVKPGASSAFIANKIMNHKDRYSKFYNLGENYLMAEGLHKKQQSLHQLDPKNRSDTSADFIYDTDSELGKECLIVPYAPESVIPINVNGDYMGFYTLEYENEAGPMWKKRRRTGSFTDYVQAQGYGNDAALLGTSAPMVAYGGSDPLENNLYSPLAMYNYSVNQYLNGGAEQIDQRFDIMKAVTLRVLSHRLRDPELVNNKMFKDVVMTLLRNDVLTRKKVQFTFIPPEYMVYMTYKTDDDGLPKSILDGTLLWAYMYISSTLSSIMIKMLKSADKEKYEVSVGLLKNAGYTIDELQRVLSTRNIYSSDMFSSLSNVIKNTGSYQRMIIPVFNDRKLYDVSQIETVNNVSPDDDFTKNLLNSILSKIYINSGMQGSFEGADFAHEFVYKNIEYRSNIIEAQANYETFITKIVKTLTYYSTIDTYNSQTDVYDQKEKKEHGNGDIDISRIKVELSIPAMMSMTNISEVLDAAKNVANTIAEAFNLNDGNTVETARNTLFKKKIIEKYANIVEWNDLEQLLDQCANEAPNEVHKSQKLAKIDEKLSADDQDSGGDDMMGGDTSGDDSGGGMDMNF